MVLTNALTIYQITFGATYGQEAINKILFLIFPETVL
jgi:hypothetical protein